jgi:Zn-dependent peptidase ImmA (M78 family)
MPKCAYNNCDNKEYARNYCYQHYRQMLNNGSVDIKLRKSNNLINNKDWLYNQYIINNKQVKEIAYEYKIPQKTIQHRLYIFNIIKGNKPTYDVFNNKDWLYNQYITLNKTLITISNEYNIPDYMIRYYLRKFGIKKK